MAVPEQPGKHPPEDDTALLIAALNHMMAFHETRIDRGLQVINYFVVAGAVLVTAYASALGGKQHGIAVAIALAGTALAILAYMIGRQQRRAAAEAEPAIAELQGRVAGKLQVDSFRIYKAETRPQREGAVTIAFALAVVLSAGAAIYAAIR